MERNLRQLEQEWVSANRALMSLADDFDVPDDAFEYLVEFLQDFSIQPRLYYSELPKALDALERQNKSVTSSFFGATVENFEQIEMENLLETFKRQADKILSFSKAHHEALVKQFVLATARLSDLQFDEVDTEENPHGPVATLVLVLYLTFVMHSELPRNTFLISTLPLGLINPSLYAPLNAALVDLGDGSILGRA